MKFCTQHTANLADELRFPVNQLGLAINTLKENPQVTLVVEVPNGNPQYIDEIRKLETLNIPYKVAVKSASLIPSFLPFVFLDVPVTDWETANFLIAAGVTDINLTGSPTFDAEAIKKLASKINIRINPSYCYAKPQASISNFFIRPEALYLWENIITTIDFQEANATREKALLDVYKQGYFEGSLNHLITNLPFVENSLIDSKFDIMRMNCKHKCQHPLYSCHYCENYINTLNMIKENNNNGNNLG